MKTQKRVNCRVMGPFLLLIAFIIGIGSPCVAADWPNWRGPNHNGISSETAWKASWGEDGPKIAWKIPIGTGFSSMAVTDGRVYAMGNINDTDIVYCLNADTGKEFWTHSYASELQAKNYEGGPNPTPTVDGNKVYTLSKHGRAFCLDVGTGAVVWEKDLQKDFGIKPPTWGFAGSPFVYKNMIILNAGIWGIALDKTTGEKIWDNGKGAAGYSTATPYMLDGKQCVAFFSSKAIGGVVAQTGELVWQYKWETSWDENIADPIIVGDRVFVSSELGVGCAVLKIDGSKVTELWRNKDMQNHLNSSVLWKGHLYGVDKKRLRCMNFETGEVTWTQTGLGKGSLMLADGKLIILSEKGKLVTAEADPGEYKEISSAQILTGKCWTVPVLANARVYARSAKGELVCVDLRLEKTACSDAAGTGSWPQFRGPDRNGKSPETGLLKSWPEEGPPLAWQKTGLGKGFSGVAIVDGKIFTMGDRDDDQFVIALDLKTREELWAAKVGKAWKTGKGGPRCTPTVDGELIYAIGTHGDLVCVEASGGKVRWRKSFAGDFGGKMMSGWGYSESPLVDGKKLLCTPGAKDAAIAALDKVTGETIWKASVPVLGPRGKDGSGYASIVVSQACGIRQYVQMMGRGVVSVAADDGRFLWGYNKIANDIANITNVLPHEDYVFCTTSYKTGSALLKLTPSGDGIKAEEIYFLTPDEFENHHGGIVLLDGYIYGGDGQNEGRLVCLDMKTGKIVWKEPPLGKRSAAQVYADGHLYYRYEKGLMTLVEATPEKLNVKGQFKLPSVTGPSWPHPVIFDRKLYIRDNDVLLCYDISAAS